jgi:hypothetical protein
VNGLTVLLGLAIYCAGAAGGIYIGYDIGRWSMGDDDA